MQPKMHPYPQPHRRHSHTHHQQPLPLRQPPPHQQSQTPLIHTHTRQPTPRILQSSETWTGFIKDHADAKCIVEAVVTGQLHAVNNFPVMMSGVRIRSGTVLVFAEKTAKVEKMRWRDGLNWSYSRISGSFLLYREVEPIPQHSHNNTPPQILENSEFILRSVRPNTQLITGGLAKRTMTVEGSCGTKFRLINYFYPNHVQHHYDTASSINLIDHAVLHTPRQDALLRRYYDHPLEPANSRDATPPLAVMSPSSPVFHSMERRRSSVMNHPVLFSQPRIPSNQSNTHTHNRRLSILQNSSHFNPPTFPQHYHPLPHETTSDYLSTRFQTQVQKYGGTLLRRKSFEYLSNHPYWSTTPILEPIRIFYSAPHIT